jgi:multiple sugar transport system permease protein
MSKKQRDRRNRTLLWIAVVVFMIVCLFPFYWLINTSLKTGQDLSSAKLIPPNPTLDNYESIFDDSNFTTALRNSVIVAGITTVLALAIGSFAGYALARLRFRGKFVLLAIILSVTTFPPIAIAAPLFKFWTDLDIYDTLPGLIPPFLAFTLPLRSTSWRRSSGRSRATCRRPRSWTAPPTSRPSARWSCRWRRRGS